MKVLIVVPVYLPATRFGGPVKSVHDLARSLAKRGIEVTVFTTNSNGPENLQVPLDRPVETDGVVVRYFPVQWPRGYFRSAALATALRNEVHSFDLVYAAWMYAHTTVAAARESGRQHVPYVISPRGMLDRNAIRQKGRMKKLAYMALVGHRVLANAEAVHFTSEGERRNAIAEIGDAKSIVIANGIEADDEKASTSGAPVKDFALPSGKRVALFLGRLSYIKGLDQLIDAWPTVVHHVPESHLVVAGPDDENLYPRLERQIAANGVSGSISYVGMVGGAAKAQLLERCELLVNPSYLESFGMSIVEAMARGKPVVVTDRVNIAPDIAKAGAGIVTRCDPTSIAGAIIELLRNTTRASSTGRAARALVERRYSLDDVADKMATAMAGVVERHRARGTESAAA